MGAVPTILSKLSSPALAALSEVLAAAHTPQPTLATLAADAGLSLPDLAASVGCEAALLERVAAGRQALPAPLLAPLSRALAVQLGEVRAAAGAVVETRDAAALRPYPADRLLSEPIYPRPTSPTRPAAFGP